MKAEPAMESPHSFSIATSLSALWKLHKTPAFVDYLATTFGCERPTAQRFDGIYIAEIGSGKASEGIIGSDVLSWWFVDDNGLREVEVEEIDFQTVGEFYRTPVVKFFVERDRVAIGERLGPNIGCRKVGAYHPEAPDGPITDVRLVWAHCK